MALQRHSGEFTISLAGGAGVKTYAHGAPFDPASSDDFVILFYSPSTQHAAGVLGDNVRPMLGAAKSASEQFVCAALDEDAQATSDTSRVTFSNACVAKLTSVGTTPTIEMIGAFVSIDGTNITLDITDAPDVDATIQFEIIAGDGLRTAVGAIGLPLNSAGNQTFDVVGFQGKLALFAQTGGVTSGVPLANCHMNIGAADGVVQFCSNYTAQDAQAASNSKTTFSTVSAVTLRLSSTGAIDGAASFVGFTADGFTLNVVDTLAVTIQVGYVVFGGAGLSTKLGSETQRTSAGLKATSGLGHEPEVLIFNLTRATAADTPTDGGNMSFGFAGGEAGDRCGSVADFFGADPSETKSLTTAGKSVKHISAVGGSVVAEANVDSVDADSVTLNWTTADASARLFWYASLRLDEVTAQTRGLLRSPVRGCVRPVVVR